MKTTTRLAFISLLFLLGNCGEKSPELCQEKPKENCGYYTDYNPVCGCNNRTYTNACEAECKGITRYTKGECLTNK
jgi:hypothetical protein